MNRITKLFNIEFPIIQAGMVWCSGWELASSVSNSGGLGIIGAGSMYPNILDSQIKKCKNATKLPFGVNLPLLYPDIDKHIEIIIKNKVPIVFTSAGSPKRWTKFLKSHKIIIVHVVSSFDFAKKCQNEGVDAIVAEGFEAGGHNGREETTSMCLIPNITTNINIPTIAAGGIASGKAMAAAFALGAEGVQIGSRFVASKESSAHINFKNAIINSNEGDTSLTLKELTPVRLLKNKFYDKIQNAYLKKSNIDQLNSLLGKGRAKKGMFEGDLEEGELEIGQISSTINKIKSASEIFDEIKNEFYLILNNLNNLNIK